MWPFSPRNAAERLDEAERRIQILRDALADVLARLDTLETGRVRPRADIVVSGDAIHGETPDGSPV